MYKIDFKQNDTKIKKLQKLHIADLAIVFENEDEEIQDRIYRLIDRKHMIKVIPELAMKSLKNYLDVSQKRYNTYFICFRVDDLRNLLMLFNREEQQKYIKQLNVTDQIKF